MSNQNCLHQKMPTLKKVKIKNVYIKKVYIKKVFIKTCQQKLSASENVKIKKCPHKKVNIHWQFAVK